ncbi:hypothetical protein KC131_21405 [Pseudomonas sp. JQ170]|nr:hypothetical protein [Pseudomonas sp. JQ170]
MTRIIRFSEKSGQQYISRKGNAASHKWIADRLACSVWPRG